jgi:hypothetical protein
VAVSSNGGAYYFDSLIDDFFKKGLNYFIKHKLEVAQSSSSGRRK